MFASVLRFHVLLELRGCVKVEVAVQGSPSLVVLIFCCGRKETLNLNHSLPLV